MIAIQFNRISYTHATVPVFDDLSWEIHDDRCTGLVGLNGSGKLIDNVRHAAGRMKEEEAVAFLNKFLFTYEQASSLVTTLSGGERSRLQMALLMLSGANFLLLDEPTNHLDIASAEVLEGALEEFTGTVLVISHDRYFLDRVVDRIAELDHGAITEYIGSYSDYQTAKRERFS